MSEPASRNQAIRSGEADHSPNSPSWLLIVGLVVGAAYYVGSLIGFALTFPDSAVSVLWPPNAIVFTALLLMPTRTWWVVFLGVFPFHIAVQLQSGVPLLLNLFWFVSNAGEALIGALFIRSIIKYQADFIGLKNVAIYVSGALLAPFLSSFIDASFVAFVGWKENTYWQTWLARLPSNVLAAFAIPPFVILSLNRGTTLLRGMSWQRWVEASILGLGLLAASLTVFCWTTTGPAAMTVLIYMPLPFLLWAAVRFGQPGASIAFLLVVVTSICGAFRGNGPFISAFPGKNVLSLQLFLIAIFLPIIVLAAFVEQNFKTRGVLDTKSAKTIFDSKSLISRLGLGVAAMALWVAYYFGSLVGVSLLYPPSYFPVIRPAAAVLLSSLLLYPPRHWPLFLLVGSVAHMAAWGQFGTSSLDLGLYYIYDCALVLVMALVLRRFGAKRDNVGSLRSTLLISTQITIITGLMAWIWPLVHLLSAHGDYDIWLEWRHIFLSNLIPLLIVTPGVMLGSDRAAEMIRRASLQQWMEFIVILAGLLGSGIGVFGLKSRAIGNFPALLYIPLPFLLWAAVRFGFAGLSVSFLVFALMTILSALAGNGPFVSQSPIDNIFWLQIFLVVLYAPLLVLVSLFEERLERIQILGETENRFRNLADSAPIMIWIADTDKRCTFLSRGWLDFTGRTLDQELGNGWFKGVHPEDIERCLRNYTESFDRRSNFSMEYRLRRFDGEYRWVLDQGTPRFTPNGMFLGYMGSAVDITERVDAEKALRRSEDQVRFFVEHTPAAVAMFDQEMRYIMTSRRWLTDYNLGDQNLIGRSHYEVFPEIPERWKEIHQHCLAGAVETCEQDPFRRFNGTTDWIRWEVRPWRAATGEIGGIIMFTEVISDRKRTEARLSAQYAITRILSESNSIAEAAPRILQTICAWLDWEVGEMWLTDSKTDRLTPVETWRFPSKVLAQLVPETQQFTFPMGGALSQRARGGCELIWIRDLREDDDARVSLAASCGLRSAFAFPILLGNESRGAIVFFSWDLRERERDLVEMLTSVGAQIAQFIERKQAEDTLRDTENLRRTIFESEPECVKLVGPDCRLLDMNPAGLAMIETDGLDQVVGQSMLPLVAPEWRAAYEEFNAAVCRGEKRVAQFEIVGFKGTRRWLESHAVPLRDQAGNIIARLSISHDITDRKRAEEELKEALAEVQRLKERLELENVYLRSEVMGAHRSGEIIGESREIGKVLEQVEKVARTDMTVLVLGETGTGKELVARLVHEKSVRRERPLVKVNCSALPAELIESELFGHERGAFTGATTKQMGRFELADGGTIFLDEIGELPLRLQVKLLRVLQEGEFERLGSGKTMKVDVRVIAATNRNLNDAVQRGRFRADLYYRLNVYPIRIAPLRERLGDIELLAGVFLQEAGRRLGKSFGRMSREVIEELQGYSWPGNVRELENVISRAAIVSFPPALQLPEGWKQPMEFEQSKLRLPTPAARSRIASRPISQTLEQFERSRIIEVLGQTDWRIEGPKGAAVILGLHPNTLRSRMQKLAINRVSRM